MNRTIRLGLFIVFTILALSIGIFLIGSKDMTFKRGYRVNAYFDSVAGLVEGANVRVGGVPKGVVDAIHLPNRADGKVQVILSMDRATRNIIRKDSLASIQSEGLLGDKYVEVSFGSEEAEAIKDGDTIRSSRQSDIADLIKKTDQILDTAQTSLESIRGATGDLQEITGKINSGKGSVGALVNDRTMYTQATQGMTAFSEDMEALKHNFLLRGFFRNRGYEDEADIRKHLIPRMPAETPSKTFEFAGKRLFAKPDTAKLKNEKDLNPAGTFLEENQWGQVIVRASTGAKGDSDKNLVLSEAQAMVVRNYIAQHFKVDDTRMKIFGLGESRTGDGKVEVLVYSQTAPAAKPRGPTRGEN
jgi:phospholipid/cholesterol/gamma-HCH transport system substrate-binding protein